MTHPSELARALWADKTMSSVPLPRAGGEQAVIMVVGFLATLSCSETE